MKASNPSSFELPVVVVLWFLGVASLVSLIGAQWYFLVSVIW